MNSNKIIKIEGVECVTKEEFNNLVQYTELIAKQLNALYRCFEDLAPQEKLRILRKSKIEEIFNAE